MSIIHKRKVDYGQDMIGLIKILISTGSLAVIAGLFFLFKNQDKNPGIVVPLLIAAGFLAFLYCAIGIWSSRIGKRIMCDRVMNVITWRGDEKVLDVGCGQGLLLIGAAKRLATGKAYGIDNYQSTFEFNNSKDKAVRNAEAEGVGDRVEIQTADARELPFPARIFDVVASSLVLHHVPEFSKALGEMARVLKKDGTIVIVDIAPMTKKYIPVLENLGLTIVENSRTVPLFLFPFRMIAAQFEG